MEPNTETRFPRHITKISELLTDKNGDTYGRSCRGNEAIRIPSDFLEDPLPFYSQLIDNFNRTYGCRLHAIRINVDYEKWLIESIFLKLSQSNWERQGDELLVSVNCLYPGSGLEPVSGILRQLYPPPSS